VVSNQKNVLSNLFVRKPRRRIRREADAGRTAPLLQGCASAHRSFLGGAGTRAPRERVQNDAGGVVARRVQAEPPDIQQMGDPSQGMPVLRVGGAPGPFETFPRQPWFTWAFWVTLNGIVQIDEAVLQTGQESAQDDEKQQDGQQGRGYCGFGLLAVCGHHVLQAEDII